MKNRILIEKLSFYEAEKEKCIELLKGQEKKSNVISILRLVSFVISICFFIFGFTKFRPLVLLGVLFILVFLFLIVLHQRVIDEEEYFKSRESLISRYIARINGKWTEFSDKGEDFINDDDTLSRDLDLLGEASLFQFLSTAHTADGRRKLYETITLKNTDKSNIDKINSAVLELGDKNDFVIDFEALTDKMSRSKYKVTKKKVDSISDVKPLGTYFFVAAVLLPVLGIVMIALTLMGVLKYYYIIIFFFLMLILNWMAGERINCVLEPVYKFGVVSGDMEKILLLFQNQEFNSEIMKNMKTNVGGDGGLIQAFKALNVLSAAVNISYNPIIHMILNGLFGWDVIVAVLGEKWSKKYAKKVNDGLDFIADTEVYISLSVLNNVRPTVVPEIYDYDKNSDNIVSMKGIFHPLLSMDKAISNTAKINDGATVITGSNMSGKTTFLRTVAINMALAFMGASVCAESMKTPYYKIFTSMRVNDDVKNGISTFYAEILRIKMMAEYVNGENLVPAACFIDEIFKGTNSADRIVGAKSAISKLSKGDGMVMVSTHDMELCDIVDSNGREVDNYHFEEYYENDSIKFDYTIKDGRCKTRNAIPLLKMAGLI